MSITTQCPDCAAKLNVADKLAGKRGKCPKCGAMITIPKNPTGQGGDEQAAPSANPPADAKKPSSRHRNAARTTQSRKRQSDSVDKTLLDAFEGNIAPVRRKPTYTLATLLVTCVMIVLPLLYVALIMLTGFAVYYHTVNHASMLEYGRGRAKIMVFLAYVAPLAIGAILVLFMIKPLFARPARQIQRRSLTRGGEPLLFAFVDRICAIVRAPTPKRIDVDYELNASASFRRGLLSILGSDLVLTIGMPMAAGLTLRQFAGVLAHEFGHFSQGIGMRLTYVVRNVNTWFARVVYERDEWDEWLEETAAEIDIRIGWILYLSQLCVWFTRRILWLLMWIGHGVSGFMLRQMEFDADRYETRLVGSETFADTSLRIRELGAAYNLTQQTVMGFLSQHKFPDDITRVMTKIVAEFPPDVRQQIQKSIESEKNGLFDTHPCDNARIASARRENAAGIFHAPGPASNLFRNLDNLAQGVTWDLYRAMGAQINPQEMDRVDRLWDEFDLASNESVTA